MKFSLPQDRNRRYGGRAVRRYRPTAPAAPAALAALAALAVMAPTVLAQSPEARGLEVA